MSTAAFQLNLFPLRWKELSSEQSGTTASENHPHFPAVTLHGSRCEISFIYLEINSESYDLTAILISKMS